MGMTESEKADVAALGDSVIITQLDKIIGWGRKYSFFLYPFVTACCGMEFMSVAGPRYDLDRFGAALPRFSPRQADLLMVVGTISHRQAPILVKVYNQMTEPKWVFAFGTCTVSGGMYDNYATVQGIDTLIPVDVYVPGCPPRPEMVIDGLIKLQQKVVAEPHQMAYKKGIAPVGEADDRIVTGRKA
ncbi:MAG: NADH-quinone oxidoreductase subunit NuoB [Nitrospinae bacterium]|nr:NADH-quinone oxidoreductase subunit NuoB [Nitrospinota bacterium]